MPSGPHWRGAACPSAASAETHSYWSTTHDKSRAHATKPGSKITVKGTVKRDGKAYEDKTATATLCFQTKAGDPATKIASDDADSKGNLSTKVTVTGPGTDFWTTTSTSKTQAGASLGDYAAAA